MHLDQPGGRPSNQNHIRGWFTIFRATQILKLDVDSGEITGHWWGSNFPLYLQKSEKTPKRYESSMKHQRWAGPNISLFHKRMQAAELWVKWGRMKQCSLNIEPPKHNITPSVLNFPINFLLIFKERPHFHFLIKSLFWHGKVYDVRTAGKPWH